MPHDHVMVPHDHVMVPHDHVVVAPQQHYAEQPAQHYAQQPAGHDQPPMMAMLRLRPGLRAVMTDPQMSGSSLAHEIAMVVVV